MSDEILGGDAGANGANSKPAGASPSERPRIYVACLAAYNAGTLHGAWIDVTTPEDIWREVSAMLRASPEEGAEEFSIHDYEGFEGLTLSEWESFEHVCALADFIGEHGALGAKLIRETGGLEEAQDAFGNYAGCHRSLAEFAEQLWGETGEAIPKGLEPYIDWEAMARDMELSGDVFTIETGFDETHVFWSR